MIARNAQRLTAVKKPPRPAAPRASVVVHLRAAARPLPSARRRAGLSLVEMLISLAITAMLLTATMVAIDASFKAYASAAETASAQASTRMVVNRLLMLVRTSIAVGPDGTGESDYIDVVSQAGDFRIRYDEDEKILYLLQGTDENTKQPLLENVESCVFRLVSAVDDDSPWGMTEVVRATVDLEVSWDEDNTLAIESDRMAPIRAIASTMPRRVD